MDEADTLLLSKYLKTFNLVPLPTADEASIFTNVEKLDHFLTTLLGIINFTGNSLSEDMRNFIEIFYMKMTRNNNPDYPQTETSKAIILRLSKKYLTSKQEYFEDKKPNLFNYYFQEDIEMNPYYVVYCFLFLKKFPHPLDFYQAFYNRVTKKRPSGLCLVASAGCILMLCEYQEYQKGVQNEEDCIDDTIADIVGFYEPLKFSLWFLHMLRNYNLDICPNLKEAEFMAYMLIRISFNLKCYMDANVSMQLWLPYWSKQLLRERFLEGMPKAHEMTCMKVMKGYKMLRNSIVTCLREQSNLSLREVTRADYIVALLKCSVRMLLFLITRLEQLRSCMRIEYVSLQELVELETEISDTFLTLMNIVPGQCTKGELLLSAFSVRPSFQTLDLIEDYAKIPENILRNSQAKRYPRQGCWYLAPKELFSENPDWPEATMNDLVSVIGRSRHKSLVETVPFKELYRKCWQVLSADRRRECPNPTVVSLQDLLAASGINMDMLTQYAPLAPPKAPASPVLIAAASSTSDYYPPTPMPNYVPQYFDMDDSEVESLSETADASSQTSE